MPSSSSLKPDPRRAAFDALGNARRQECFIDDALADTLARLPLDERDRRLAFALAQGAVKYALTLDRILASFSRTPVDQIEPDVLTALRLGVVQLVYLDRIPPHAAVNETVSLVSAVAKPHVTRYANGVLRAVSRSVTRQDAPVSGGLFDPRQLPLGEGRVAVFDREIVPARSLEEILSVQYSYPAELTKRFIEAFGLDGARRLLDIGNRAPAVLLRPNPHRIVPEVFVKRLSERGAEARRLDSGLVWTNNSTSPAVIGALDGGFASVQDSASFAAVMMLLEDVDPHAPIWALDTCAAPGGKATAMAERLSDDALVVACDINEVRMKRVTENVGRLGLRNMAAVVCDGAAAGRVFDRRFDRVICDVPCSNTGVLRRRAEARYRVTPQALAGLRRVQRRLIAAAWRSVEPGGRLCYSTCSLLPEENEAVVDELMATESSAKLLTSRLSLPDSEGNEGGFAALLLREE